MMQGSIQYLGVDKERTRRQEWHRRVMVVVHHKSFSTLYLKNASKQTSADGNGACGCVGAWFFRTLPH